jgi:uncharacterized membrane protein
VNDPTTAATSVSYIRSALTRLASREFPSEVRRGRDGAEPLVVRRRSFAEYLETLAEISRSAVGDVRITADLLRALGAITAAANRAGARDRAREAVAIADSIREQALDAIHSSRDRTLLEAALGHVDDAVRST